MNPVWGVFRRYYKKNIGRYILFYFVYIARVVSLVFVPLISKTVLDSVVPSGSISQLILWTAVAVVAQSAVMFTQLGTTYLCRALSVGLKNLMKTEMLKSFLRKDSEKQTITGTGYILKRIESDVELFTKFVNSDLVTLIYGVIMFLTTLVLIYQYNVLLLASTLLSLPLLVTSMAVFNKKITESTAQKNEAIAQSSKLLSECILGQKEIREYSATEEFLRKFWGRLQTVSEKTLNALREQFKPSIMGQTSTLVGKVSLLGIGGYALIQGKLTFGEYFAFSILVQYTYRAVGYLFQGNISYQQSKAVVGRMSQIFSEESLRSCSSISSSRQTRPSESIDCIELDNVGYRYPSESRNVIDGITTELRKGEIVALVGRSGSGKSTLMGLVKREFKPNNGVIRINGLPVNDFELDDYLRRIATIRQNPFIFSGSIRENIEMGYSAEKQQLHSVIGLAHLDDFLCTLESGLNTHIHENAGNISGGQKQRIALARAFLRQPDILLLDEITTGMDKIARDKIHDSILQMKSQAIILLVTHFSETVELADRIILLDGGGIVAEGNHAELYNSSSLYRELFESMGNNDECNE